MLVELHVPISVGELIDKLTILSIKLRRLDHPERLENVRHEHEALEAVARSAGLRERIDLADLEGALLDVNEALWQIEDAIRDCERMGDFGPAFVELARSVYRTNDRRSALKRQINLLCGSSLIEEKSYSSY